MYKAALLPSDVVLLARNVGIFDCRTCDGNEYVTSKQIVQHHL